jgi:hypothetical protein
MEDTQQGIADMAEEMKQDFEDGMLSRLEPAPPVWLGWALIAAGLMIVAAMAALVYWWPM